MKLYRLWGVSLRYLYLFRHSLDRLSDAFFWPTVDLVLWGMASRSLTMQSSASSTIILGLLGGVILWIFPWRSQYEIAVNLLEDLWNRNLVNLFISPLRFFEWVTSLLLLGVAKALTSFVYAGALTFFLYKTNIFTLGWLLLPWALLLILFGWVFGLLVAAIIMRYGTKIQTLAWTSIYFIAPFACVFYPAESLPEWGQTIAKLVPASYVFEAMRNAVVGTPVPLTDLILPTLLCAVYFVLSIVFIRSSFNKVLSRGLISVE